jgi:alpha-ketoglutarate-dependent dioxygenase FTO
VTLKPEPSFKKDKMAVSWHADSTLEHFSSIAVYQTIPKSSDIRKGNSMKKSKVLQQPPWRVALRVLCDAEGPNSGKRKIVDPTSDAERLNSTIPAVAIPLPDKSTYFLLDDFNHHHQHAVLAGNSVRFSSTHRVCRTDGHVFASIRSRAVSACQKHLSFSAKDVRSYQGILNELEFEWIRQFYIQGAEHYRIHSWWHGPMQELVGFWYQLEKKTNLALSALKDAGGMFIRAHVIINIHI